tara:strand:- start:247 stop:609 length:363 start_codon:yes stop_codon:yes gene_type:complete
MKVVITEEQFNRIILQEQKESNIITSKELKKLSKKGWESGTPGFLISQIIKLDTEFYSFDGVGQWEDVAVMSSEHLFNRWRKENGLDPRTSTWRKTIYKKEPNVVHVKTLFPVSKFNKKG